MRALLPFLICLSFASCDCYVQIEGTIIDKSSGKPISGAVYRNKSKNWIANTTDSSGHFHLTTVTGTNCSLPILVEKEGYQSLDSTMESGQHILQLVPLQKPD